MAQKSKAYRAAADKIEAGKYYTPTEAVALAKETGSAKFDSTVEVALKLGVDPRKADQMVRGTVTPDVAKAVSDIKGGKIEFRVDKHANVHFVVGKASFSADQLTENIDAALEEIVRLKPSSAKGRYITKGAVSTTFGPGIPLEVNAI
jgi:ribosomal protein L1